MNILRSISACSKWLSKKSKKTRKWFAYATCTIYRSLHTRRKTIRSRCQNVWWSLHIVKRFQSSSIFLKRFVSLNATCRDKRFFDVMQNRNLILTLSKNSIMWKIRNSINIINLTFMTIYLTKKLKHYITRFDFDQSSNHIFISIKSFCNTKSNLSRIACKTWKFIDLNKIKKTMNHAFTLQSSITIREIDICVNEI